MNTLRATNSSINSVEAITARLNRTSVGNWRFNDNNLTAGDKDVLIASQLPTIEDQIFIEEAKSDIKFLLTELDRRQSYPKKIGKLVGEFGLKTLMGRI